MADRYLATYFDPGLAVNLKLKPGDLAEREIARLINDIMIAKHSHWMKRRLGADATREALARDKKVTNRIYYTLRVILSNWDGSPDRSDIEPTLEQQQQGAQRVWDAWVAEQRPALTARMRYVATYATLAEVPEWGCIALNRLENEIKWLEYTLR
jgi:hypothetical protein